MENFKRDTKKSVRPLSSAQGGQDEQSDSYMLVLRLPSLFGMINESHFTIAAETLVQPFKDN